MTFSLFLVGYFKAVVEVGNGMAKPKLVHGSVIHPFDKELTIIEELPERLKEFRYKPVPK